MPNLTLQPTFHELTREQHYERLEAVRARRMAAAVTFYEGKNAKLEHKSGVIRLRRDKTMMLLEKDFEKIDKLISQIEDRLEKVEQWDSEVDLLNAAMVEVEDE